MKEFEKWWKKNCAWKVDWENASAEIYAEEAWRTALKWAIKGLRKHECIGASHWVGDFIEEELKDE